jgi:uncharacterized surface anchored protein
VVSSRTVTFTLNNAADILDCTYTNKKQLGALKVTKASIKGNTALAGAVFTIGGGVGDKTTNPQGFVCVDHLSFGTYSVVEKSAPPGYSKDDSTSHNIVVDSSADCSNVTAADTLNFNDTPLTDIDVSANSQDDGAGGTLTTITCKDDKVPPVNLPGSPTSNVHDPSLSVDNLKPGTYTCVLLIDP